MEKCNCHRGWPIQNKKLGMCRACVFEYRNGGEESFEESQNTKNKATQERMLSKQLEKQKESSKTSKNTLKSTPIKSTFGAGVEMELDPTYATYLNNQKSLQSSSKLPRHNALPRASKPIAKVSKKGREQVEKDNETYEAVWNRRTDDGCENCGAYIGSELFDERGKIMDRSRFSHILTKAAYPEFRNNPLNFNLLCFDCHQQWEFGDNISRSSMAIWAKNQQIIAALYEQKLNSEKLRSERFED